MTNSPAARTGTPQVWLGRHTHLRVFIDEMVMRAGQRASITTRPGARVSDGVIRRWDNTARIPVSCTVSEMLAQVLSQDEMFLLALGAGSQKYAVGFATGTDAAQWSACDMWADVGKQRVVIRGLY
jgi:hypothetical protein